MFDAVKPDLVLLDVMLPKISGVDVCRELRRRSTVPIIMVTAKGSEIDTWWAWRWGPTTTSPSPTGCASWWPACGPCCAAARSTPRAAPASARPSRWGTRLDPERHEVEIRRAGEAAAQGVRAAELLLANAGRVLPQTLIDRVWGTDYVGDTKTLDVHVKRLRAKVERDPAVPTRIVTIRGWASTTPAGVTAGSRAGRTEARHGPYPGRQRLRRGKPSGCDVADRREAAPPLPLRLYLGSMATNGWEPLGPPRSGVGPSPFVITPSPAWPAPTPPR